MPLTAEQLKKTWVELVEDILLSGPVPYTKADLKAAATAVDDWVDSNAATYNASLPQPFKGGATAAQKAVLLAAVALRRAGK